MKIKKMFAALLFVPAMAQAEFYTGNELFTRITDTSSLVNQMSAMGYVVGVYDVGVHMFFCPPRPESNITVGQINDMVKNWLYANPQRRNELAHRLVLEAFKQAWPCANRSGTNGRGA